MAYKPRTPFSVAMYLLTPTYSNAYGVNAKSYPSTQAELSKCPMIFGSFKTYGGTEIVDNGIYTIEDTAQIETWYRPDITPNCRIRVAESGLDYEIISAPEDIDMRHQYMKFKVKRLKGNA